MKKIFFLGIIVLSFSAFTCTPKTTSTTKELPATSLITKVEYTKKIGSEEALANRLVTSLENGKIPVLYFHASWCGPCRAFKATIPDTKVQTAMKDIDLIMVNVDKAPDLASKYGVRYIPYLVKVDAKGEVLATISSADWGQPTPKNVSIAMTNFLN